jgi:hypothetical protein
MRIAIVLLAACNQVWDLDGTRLSNTPGECPSIGDVPQFRPGLLQVLSRICGGYNFASETAVASCYYSTPPNHFAIETGPIDGPLAPADVPRAASIDHTIATLSRDGNRLYVRERDADANEHAIAVYRRSGSSWQMDPALRLDLQGDGSAMFGPIATDGARDHVIVSRASWQSVTEYVVDQTWTEVRTQAATAFGSDEVHGLAMTSDGLRAIFKGVVMGNFKPFYTDRERIDMPFRAATILENVPYYDNAFMTDDCARIYVSGVGSIFYARQ